MLKWLIKTGLKFVSYQTLVETIAAGIAYVLDYARTNATPTAWENAKDAVKQIKNWTTLLDEVYEDDTLTPEEEKKIQDAIASCTATTTIYNLLQGKKAPAKKKASSKKTETTSKKKVNKK